MNKETQYLATMFRRRRSCTAALWVKFRDSCRAVSSSSIASSCHIQVSNNSVKSESGRDKKHAYNDLKWFWLGSFSLKRTEKLCIKNDTLMFRMNNKIDYLGKVLHENLFIFILQDYIHKTNKSISTVIIISWIVVNWHLYGYSESGNVMRAERHKCRYWYLILLWYQCMGSGYW